MLSVNIIWEKYDLSGWVELKDKTTPMTDKSMTMIVKTKPLFIKTTAWF